MAVLLPRRITSGLSSARRIIPSSHTVDGVPPALPVPYLARNGIEFA